MSNTKTQDQAVSPATSRSTDGLGVNRLGDTILCCAWGETDRPHVMLAQSKSEVGKFICEEWIADPLDPLLAEILTELEQHDWSEEGKLQYDFEIGGVSFEDVAEVTPNSQFTQPGSLNS